MEAIPSPPELVAGGCAYLGVHPTPSLPFGVSMEYLPPPFSQYVNSCT